ncbi:sulfotransferase [Pseudoxanthomonas sp. UTMC 1351]|uniref:tetratricopeptide repeat-containing sulfotransferase family protein n=1 Tax=Pseudoxanthomonas sp. UTMC 1351 TaxID=2695853 RepID=UPI0034CF1BB7
MEIGIVEALFHEGRYDQVETLARETLVSVQNAQIEAQWLNLLAFSLAAQARPQEAREIFARLARVQPHEPAHLLNLGNACLEAGDPHAAVEAFEKARSKGAEGVVRLLGHGLALLACAKFEQARKLLADAHALEPDAVDVRLAYAQCLAELEYFDRIEGLVGSLEDEVLTREQRRVHAWLLAQAGIDERAVAAYQRLLAEDSEDVESRIKLALLLERLNRLDQTDALLRHGSVAQAPMDAMKALALGRLRRRSGDPAGAAMVLEQARTLASPGAMMAQLHFELAKCHEGTNQPEACMAALAVAHEQAEVAFGQRFPHVSRRDVLGWLNERIDQDAPATWQSPIEDGAAQDPVFLVGFPRSGTTLLERVLAAHPALDVLDERPALEAVIAGLQRLPGWHGQSLADALDGLDPVMLQTARRTYWREAKRHVVPHGRLVDKYPLYLTRVPYVARLFPRSDWLLLLRHPCDCVLSCHMQAFGMNGGALVFRSLETTAEAYAAVMEHWESQISKMRMPVHVLRYEDLVMDFHGQLDCMMAFLSLARTAAQDDFSVQAARRDRRINTPSYSQVIQPVNSSAVGRWQRYRRHFGQNTLDLLRPWVARYGYSLE